MPCRTWVSALRDQGGIDAFDGLDQRFGILDQPIG